MTADIPARFGKYEVRALLGQGAMGRVYQCHDPDIDRLVAVKVVHPHHLEERQAREVRERFRREAKATARCQHPNIVTVHDMGEQDGCSFIVMEYVQGEELRFFLDRGEALCDAERLYILQEVLKALEHAHDHGVVHRDIKPANIILVDDGGVKVADFGVARIEESDLTLSGSMLGTPTYMAPEGLRGEAVGPRGDLYSVGMVMLEMFTGCKPSPETLYQGRLEAFIEEVLAREGASLPEPLRAVLHRALAIDPADRFATAREFREAIASQAAEQEGSPGETLSQTVMSREPLPVGGSPLHAPPVDWPEGLLGQVRELLAEQVGPLADVLIDRAMQQADSVAALGETLAGSISDPSDRARFLGRYRACTGMHLAGTRSGSNVTDAASGGASARPPAPATGTAARRKDLDGETLDALGMLLATYMGPLAGSLVRHHHMQVQDPESLLQRLADCIPDSEERRQFLNRARALL